MRVAGMRVFKQRVIRAVLFALILALPASAHAQGAACGSPTVASWAAGRLDLFQRGPDSSLRHKFFGGAWSAWEGLGGFLASDPVAVSWGPGRIDVFLRGTDDAIWHRFYDNGWSDWESLGGATLSRPAVASWAPGRLDVFIRGTDNQMWHRFFAGAWSPWEPMGGSLASEPAAVSFEPGRIDVFAQGTDNVLYHKFFDNGRWIEWHPHGGVLSAAPGVSSWGPGRLDVFARGSDGLLYHLWFDNALTSNVWEPLGDAISTAPSAVSWDFFRIDLFACRSDGALLHKWFDGRWSAEVQSGPAPATATLASLSAVQGPPGRTLTLTGSGFDPSAAVSVRFFDDRGFDTEVQALGPTTTSVAVAVPPYFNVGTGGFAASPGTLSVQVVQRAGGFTARSNTIGGFRIDALPSSGAATGSVTLQWLDRMIQESQEATRRLDARSRLFPQATPQTSLRSSLDSQLTTLTNMRAEVAGISGGSMSGVTFGRIGGNAVQLDRAALSVTDGLTVALLQEVANAPRSAVEQPPMSIPFLLKPIDEGSEALFIPNLAIDLSRPLDELFANIQEGIERNERIMSRMGEAMLATGLLISATGAGAPAGLALASLGALTWFVAVHAHTGIQLSLDIGTAQTLEGSSGYNNALAHMRGYVTDVAQAGASFVAGHLSEASGRLGEMVSLGNSLRGLTQDYIENTRRDFEAGRIPPAGATGLPTQQSCCVISGGCPGETGTRCAVNCCCCGLGFACDTINTTNGCIPRP